MTTLKSTDTLVALDIGTSKVLCLVADLDNQVRRILDYCELPFEQNCIEFYKSKRAVKTPSAEQVRQPIYKEGLDYWKNYEPYLGDLAKNLKY